MSSVLVCHSYVTRIYSYIICMSLVCTRMSSVCHLYVIRMPLVSTHMLSVYHSYVLVCHPYVTSMWFYHERSMFYFFLVGSFFRIKAKDSSKSEPLFYLCVQKISNVSASPCAYIFTC